MSNDMGPGDFADVGADSEADQTMPPPSPGATSGASVDDSLDDIDAVRSSEVDDITASTLRPPQADAAQDGAVEGDLLDEVDVIALLNERDEFRQLAQRVQADFDNFRRRSATQAQNDVDRATGQLAEALLPVLDAAEAAFLRHPDEVGPLLNQMLVELRKQGLEGLDLDGQPFDPEVAEAVAHEPGGGGDPVVAEVLRSGYVWKGRTLRPAMVRTRD